MNELIYTGGAPKKEIFQMFTETLEELIRQDPDVVYIDADLMSSMRSNRLWEEYPNNVFNTGIQEANMVGVAAGMNLTGLKPYVHSFAPFAARRALDQLYISIGYAGKSIRVIGSEPGICAADNGGTHMCFEDIAIMRGIPYSCVIDVSDANQFREMLKSTKDREGVTYFRTPRRGLPDVYSDDTHFDIGQGKILRHGGDLTIIASGIMLATALEAAKILEESGIRARVVDPVTIKPLDAELIVKCAKETGAVVTAENHSIIGGLGSAVAELLAEERPMHVFRVGVDNKFGQVGKEDYLRPVYNLQHTDIIAAAQKAIAAKGGAKKKALLNYEMRVDSFAKKAHIKSDLIIGDPAKIKNPWISYIVPAYMRPDLLRETLESILGQIKVGFEWDIVVSDNEAGGENGTERLIRELNSDRILYYRSRESLTANGNWNRAIELARGQWVAMVHADDLVMSDHLSVMAEYIRKYENKGKKKLAYISPQYIEFTDRSNVNLKWCNVKARAYDGMPFREKRLVSTTVNLQRFTYFDALLTGSSVFLASNGTVMNRQVMLDTGGFNPDHGVVSDIIKPYSLAKDYRVYKTPRPLGFYRFGSNATMRPGVIHKIAIGCNNLSEYIYNRNFISRIWGDVARDEKLDSLVNILMRYARYGNFDIKRSDFDDIHINRSGIGRNVRQLIYRTVMAIYKTTATKYSQRDIFFRFFSHHMKATCKVLKKHMPPGSRLILYGAGEVGRMALQYLRKHCSDIDTAAFAITNKTNDQSETDGLPVYCIGEIDAKDKNNYFLVSTLPVTQNKIIKHLEDLGFDNIFYIL